jgi:hypothetical protein
MRSIWNEVETDWSEPLWRYLRADRFIQILETSTLYFASANQFADPWEGAVAVVDPDLPLDPRYPEGEMDRPWFELKRLTKLSCWHRSEHESDAMWRLYAGSGKGVAIRTTPERLRDALKPYRIKPEYGHEDLWFGDVQYVDLTKERLRKAGDLTRFYFKHRAFSSEQEFRLAISMRTAEENAVQVPEHGIVVDVDLDRLIETVVLGPTSDARERAAAEEVARRFGLGDRVVKSELLGRPRYI